MNNLKKTNGGYLVITTAIVLSLILMILSITFGLRVFYSRSASLDQYSKKISFFLARVCEEQARLKLAQNISYAGNETVTISGAGDCSILAVESAALTKIVKTSATFNGMTTNLKLTIDNLDLKTISLEEVSRF